jgi:hypothetical protein
MDIIEEFKIEIKRIRTELDATRLVLANELADRYGVGKESARKLADEMIFKLLTQTKVVK